MSHVIRTNTKSLLLSIYLSEVDLSLIAMCSEILMRRKTSVWSRRIFTSSDHMHDRRPSYHFLHQNSFLDRRSPPFIPFSGYYSCNSSHNHGINLLPCDPSEPTSSVPYFFFLLCIGLHISLLDINQRPWDHPKEQRSSL